METGSIEDLNDSRCNNLPPGSRSYHVELPSSPMWKVCRAPEATRGPVASTTQFPALTA